MGSVNAVPGLYFYMKGNAMHTGCVVYAHWRGLLVTGSVMSEAADRVSVVGLRRLPFILNGEC